MRLPRFVATALAAMAAAFIVPAQAQDPVAQAVKLIGQYDYDGAIAILEPACKAGNTEACWRLALAHSRNYSDESIAAADKQFLANCAKGDARSCFMVADRVGYSDDPKDQAKRNTGLTKACNGGLGFACIQLGNSLEYNNDETKIDPDGALRAFEKGCELGFGAACSAAAELYQQDRNGRTGDPLKGLPFAIKGCDLGDGSACAQIPSLEGLQLDEDTTPAQRQRWQGFHEKACRLGETDSCTIMLTKQLEL